MALILITKLAEKWRRKEEEGGRGGGAAGRRGRGRRKEKNKQEVSKLQMSSLHSPLPLQKNSYDTIIRKQY